MYELPNESPNDLRLRILGNFNKIPEKLGIDSKSPASHPKNQISTVVVEKCEKICCTKETPILLNFVNVYKILPMIVWEIILSVLTGPRPHGI